MSDDQYGDEADDGIESPPYPTDHTSALMLYRYLALLRRWLLGEQSRLRALPTDVFPDDYRKRIAGALPPLSSEGSWDLTSVMDKYITLMYMRRIRETWDHILREHEDQTWDRPLAVSKRCSVVLMSRYLVREAFVDSEQRALRGNALEDTREHMRALDNYLRDVLLPPELRKYETDGLIDPDDMGEESTHDEDEDDYEANK